MMKHLRKLALLLVLVTTTCFYSCSVEDPEITPDNAELILGKWQFENGTYQVISDDTWFQEYAQETYGHFNEDLAGVIFDFKTDNELFMVFPGNTEACSYSLDGDQLSFEGEDYTIKTLTNDSLVFSWSSDTIYVNYVSGIVIQTYYFKR